MNLYLPPGNDKVHCYIIGCTREIKGVDLSHDNDKIIICADHDIMNQRQLLVFSKEWIEEYVRYSDLTTQCLDK